MTALIKYYLGSLFRQPEIVLLMVSFLGIGAIFFPGDMNSLFLVIMYLVPFWLLRTFSFQEMELSLPFSREKIFFARLLALWIPALTMLVFYFAWRVIMLDQPWDLAGIINAAVWLFALGAYALLVHRYVCFMYRGKMIVTTFFVAVGSSLAGGIIFGIFHVLDLQVLTTIAIGLAVAIVLTFLACRSYHNTSLSKPNGLFTAVPISRPVQITSVLPLSSFFFKIIRSRSVALRIILTETFTTGPMLLLAIYILFVLYFLPLFLTIAAGKGTIEIFGLLFVGTVFMGTTILSSPKKLLSVFAFVPYPRRRLFRIAFFAASAPLVLMAIIGLGVYCNRINTFAEIPKNTSTYNPLGKEDVPLDYIFSRYVNRSVDGGGNVWLKKKFESFCRVMDETEYLKNRSFCKYGRRLLAGAYAPYSLSENDTVSFAAYQVSRYVLARYGFSLSPDDVKDIANKWPGAEYKGHACLAMNVINAYHKKLINALIKIRIGMVLLFLTALMWAGPIIGSFSPNAFIQDLAIPQRGRRKSIALFLTILLLIIFACWGPSFYAVLYMFNRLAVMHFGLLLTACAFLSAAAYLIMERRFNSLEAGNIRQSPKF